VQISEGIRISEEICMLGRNLGDVSQWMIYILKILFICFFNGSGVSTQGLTLTRQVLLLLEPPCLPFFVMAFFEIGCLELFASGWLQTSILLISAS
jgi:hypothetical protein